MGVKFLWPYTVLKGIRALDTDAGKIHKLKELRTVRVTYGKNLSFCFGLGTCPLIIRGSVVTEGVLLKEEKDLGNVLSNKLQKC